MKRLAIRLSLGVAALLLLLVIVGYGFLRGGAPALDGTRRLEGLGAAVTVSRDGLGVPTITARSRADMARALGFLHAQDRFFQMDLLRRVAAGELSELFGAAAVDFDKQHRLYRLRAVARQVLARATPEQRAVLAAYSEGVNAGLKGLTTWPFEYGLLFRRPRPWRPEDSILVIDAMYFDLQDPDDRRESNLAVMRDLMPPALYRFLSVSGTQWDAPVVGKPPDMPPIPGADVVDLRKQVPVAWVNPGQDEESRWMGFEEGYPSGAIGSNNFAVSAAHGADSSAIFASDMHLGLRVPNIWYRAQLRYADARAEGGQVTVTGVTLPGLPQIVAGSNGHVAWGYTNGYGDWVDLVELHLDPDDADQYQTPDGWRHFDHRSEVIRVKGGADVKFEVRDTIWGPVLDQDHKGVTRAVRWIASDPDATNLELENVEWARDVREAMAVANHAGMPEQNFLTADSAGHIAWTLSGRIPVRKGYDPSQPSYWDKPGTGWSGWLAPENYPRVIDPKAGRLWTANARVVDGAMLTAIGDGGYDLGARAGQIRDDLMAREIFKPADLLAIELDDRALFLARWRTLLMQLLTPEQLAGRPDRAEFRHYVEDWSGHASTDSVGYRLVKDFRTEVQNRVFEPLFAACHAADPRFDFHHLNQLEGPLWAMVTQQPKNLLDPQYKDWNALLLAAVDQVIVGLARPKTGLAGRDWGERNVVRIRHPMSPALPFLSGFLDMAPVSLPGDVNMPRVQGVDFGPSERMVIEPGREEQSIFEMPAGQSAWPLSPYYRNSEPFWEKGEVAPFLPGKPEHTLVFEPAGAR